MKTAGYLCSSFFLFFSSPPSQAARPQGGPAERLTNVRST